jgi:hypothetical protein
MMRSNKTCINAALSGLMLLALVVGTPKKAFGYVDPGTGTFVYQAAYAAIVGGAFYFRKLLRRFRGNRDNLNK